MIGKGKSYVAKSINVLPEVYHVMNSFTIPNKSKKSKSSRSSYRKNRLNLINKSNNNESSRKCVVEKLVRSPIDIIDNLDDSLELDFHSNTGHIDEDFTEVERRLFDNFFDNDIIIDLNLTDPKKF